MTKSVRLRAGAALGAALLSVAGAAQAQARPLNRALRLPAPAKLTAGTTGPSAGATRTSTYAGYLGSLAQGVSSLGSTVTVPSLTCPAAGSQQSEVDIAEGSSTFDAEAGVALDCVDGTALYQLFAITDDQQTSGGFVSPGDRVILSANVTAGGTYAEAVDPTDGQSAVSSGGAPTSAPSVYQFLLYAGGTTPHFSPITFRYAQVNARHLASLAPTRYSLISPSGDAFATTFSGPFSQTFSIYHRPGS